MILILGMGITGLSVAKFLTQQKIKFMIVDSRVVPPLLKKFLSEFPTQAYFCGKLDETFLKDISKIVVSPGVDLKSYFVQLAIKKNIKIIGDMDLFFAYVKKPVIGITGTNGKSTVTTLITQMINDSGLNAVMGGNIGKAALDCLSEEVDFYVLELSSYQLDLTKNMPLEVAVVLNITQDHLDRYPKFSDYVSSKLSIYDNTKTKIVNADDPNIKIKGGDFSLGVNAEFARVTCHGGYYLLHNDEVLLATNELKILGPHNHLNALASLAIGYKTGLNKNKMLTTLRQFSGLKHRLQKVATYNEIDYFNDSKATNSDATIVAIKTLKPIYTDIILIIGGVAKEDNYDVLTKNIQENIKTVVLIGANTELFLKTFKGIKMLVAKDMTEAVSLANRQATVKTAVLLSPACASFDMFDNFEQRGDVFIKTVETAITKSITNQP